MTISTSRDQGTFKQISDIGGVGGFRRFLLLRLQTKIFMVVLVAILSFGAGLQYWNQRTLFANEVRLASDKHLVIASNLALSLSRYMRDASLLFKHAVQELHQTGADQAVIESHVALLSTINIEGLKILSPQNGVLATFAPPGAAFDLPDETILENLRIGTNAKLHDVQISGVTRVNDERYFIMGLNLPGEQLAIGYLSLDYIKAVQQKISFGELGHSAIFDATGRAVAHPSARVEENMMDASGISTVSKMLNRQTGVDIFFSPPMQADMIAGFTFIPETGWPVMVPQPLQELTDSVNSSLRQTYGFAIMVALVLAIFGLFAAQTLVRPIRRFTDSSLAIAKGDYDVELPESEHSSLEMWNLNEALKTMVDHVRFSDSALRTALELEETENQRKSDFMIMASHELRNPLSGVIGMLSVCKEKASEEDVLKYLEIALRSAAQLERIVNELVLYAEDGVDIVSVQEELFNCVEEFGKIAGIYAKQAQDAGLEFQYSVQAGSDQNICTDQHRLFQIVGNLIENAVKYTKNGNVWLGVTLNAEPGDEKGWLDVTVTDTGIGMDEADMDRIFEPFFQADRSFSRSYNGLGIGLSISQAMAKRLGGEITCQSEKGKGSEFRLRLPVVLD